MYIFATACVGLIGAFFIDECADTVQISEHIFDRTHEEIEDTLSNLISIYTSNKIGHESGELKF